MVKHIILWKFKDLTDEQKKEQFKLIKTNLEGLQGIVPGLEYINVQMEKLDTSNADLMLDCTFTDEEALKGYAKHPAHNAVANEYIRPYIETRMCIDYEI